MWWFSVIILVVLFVLAMLPVFEEGKRRTIGKAARKNQPGKLAKLGRGQTYYQWVGPVRGPVAVLIHGLTTPSAIWENLAGELGGFGYRVLVYDLYGRGLSDAPKGPQDRAFFVDQLTELLDDQNLSGDITLVGYSMGGSIATSFAAKNPHRTKQLILLASAGVLITESKFSAFCRTVPVLGDWLHSMIGVRRMKTTLTDTPDAKGVVLAAQTAELRRKGFLRSVLASRRGMLAETLEKEHRAIGRDDIPVVAIWGEQDKAIPIAAVGRLSQWNRSARQDQIAQAGHGLPYTHSAEVSAILRDVFREV